MIHLYRSQMKLREGYAFTGVCDSVHGGGGGYPSMHCRPPGPHPGEIWGFWPGGVSWPTPRGKLRGLAWGGLQAHTQGGSWRVWPGGTPGPHLGGSPGPYWGYPSMHWGRSPSGQLLLWAVRILLECILVEVCCHQSIECWHPIYCETPFEFLVFN